MESKKLEIVIIVPGGIQYRFVIMAHRTASVGERLIEPEFYKNHSLKHEIPEGDHHEIEILEPALWKHEHAKKIHTHPIGTRRHFVCYTSALPTIKDVEAILRVWCVGTVYTMITGLDFGAEYARGQDSFHDRMRDEHGITIKPA